METWSLNSEINLFDKLDKFDNHYLTTIITAEDLVISRREWHRHCSGAQVHIWLRAYKYFFFFWRKIEVLGVTSSFSHKST